VGELCGRLAVGLTGECFIRDMCVEGSRTFERWAVGPFGGGPRWRSAYRDRVRFCGTSVGRSCLWCWVAVGPESLVYPVACVALAGADSVLRLPLGEPRPRICQTYFCRLGVSLWYLRWG